MYRLKRLFRRFRQQSAPPQPTTGEMAVRNRFADLKQLIAKDDPIIIDGGANTGTVTDIFLKQYASPTIHAFEPRPGAASEMQEKYATQPNVHIHVCAIGSQDDTLSFNVTQRATSSSFLKPSSAVQHYHPTSMDIEKSIDVQVKRLDSVLDTEIDIMKLDLQGYELEALKGCGALLHRVKTITTEVEFISLYDEQPLFADIDIFLRAHGFRLYNLYELWTKPDGQLTAGDAVYVNRMYFPQPNRNEM